MVEAHCAPRPTGNAVLGCLLRPPRSWKTDTWWWGAERESTKERRTKDHLSPSLSGIFFLCSLSTSTRRMNMHLLLHSFVLKSNRLFLLVQAAGGHRAHRGVPRQDEAAGCGRGGRGRRGPETLPGLHAGRCAVWQPLRCVLLSVIWIILTYKQMLFELMNTCSNHCC